MKSLSYILFFSLVCVASLASKAQALELTAAAATTSATKTTWQHKNLEIILYGPDNPNKPIVWEGPLQIKNKSKTSHYDTQLADQLYIVNDVLFILSYSGSNHYLDVINLTSLSHLVKTRSISSSNIEIDQKLITVQPACECIENDICHCNAAQVFNWNMKGITHNKTKSLALTKKLLGAAFDGLKLFRNHLFGSITNRRP